MWTNGDTFKLVNPKHEYTNCHPKAQLFPCLHYQNFVWKMKTFKHLIVNREIIKQINLHFPIKQIFPLDVRYKNEMLGMKKEGYFNFFLLLPSHKNKLRFNRDKQCKLISN